VTVVSVHVDCNPPMSIARAEGLRLLVDLRHSAHSSWRRARVASSVTSTDTRSAASSSESHSFVPENIAARDALS
jgi:hypothetical protein